MAKKNKFYRHIIYYAVVAAQKVFSALPYRLGFSFGGTIGKITYHVLLKERKRTLTHLRTAFGDEKSVAEYESIGKRMFEHYGKTIAELGLIKKIILNIDERVRFEGLHHVDEALKAGKGAIIVMAHFGNWELMGAALAFKGYPCHAIARRIYFEKYNRLLSDFRATMKVRTIYRDESPKTMLKALKSNGIVGFAVDQDIDSVESVFVDFFGRPAYTATAPVRFAMLSGAPLIPSFIVREGMNHRILVQPPVPIDNTGNREEDVKVTTQRWVRIQEDFIRRYPHFWVWNHRRWKTSPK